MKFDDEYREILAIAAMATAVTVIIIGVIILGLRLI